MCLVMLTSCGVPSSFEEATAEVTRFHEQFNELQFDEIWKGADAQFRQRTTYEEFLAFFEHASQTCGRVNQSKAFEYSIKTSGAKARLVVEMRTKFERADAIEEFVFEVYRGRVGLMTYNLRVNKSGLGQLQ